MELSEVKDIIVSFAAIVTAGTAYFGLQKWKAELKGKADFETARALSKSIYALRNELDACRAPLITPSEFPNGYHAKLKHTNEEVGDAYSHIYKNRWSFVVNTLNGFDTATLEAEALWGKTIKDKTNALKDCVWDLRNYIDAFVDDKYSGGAHFHIDPDFAKEVRNGVSRLKREDNKLTIKIQEAIEGIEDVIKPHLARK